MQGCGLAGCCDTTVTPFAAYVVVLGAPRRASDLKKVRRGSFLLSMAANSSKEMFIGVPLDLQLPPQESDGRSHLWKLCRLL